MLKLGEKSIKSLYLGTKAISKAYWGDKLVFGGKNYSELEYLATTGQQTNNTTTNASWIDIGVVPSDNICIECRMAFTTLISGSSQEALFGVTATNGRMAWGFANLSPQKNFYVGLGAQNLTSTVERDTEIHTFKIDARNKTWQIDEETGSFTSSGSVSANLTIFLFGRHGSATGVNKPANARVYYCKIWDNDTLIRDYIPVLDKDNVPCMYDKVTKQFFYNQGTGEFLYE